MCKADKICKVWNEEQVKFKGYNDRLDGCPLKPMPNKLDANDWHRMFGGTYKEREAKGYGWNACLEEIENAEV